MTDPTYVKISKLSYLKPIHARWIANCYNQVLKEKDMKLREFSFAVIHKAVQNVEDIYEKIENPFKE